MNSISEQAFSYWLNEKYLSSYMCFDMRIIPRNIMVYVKKTNANWDRLYMYTAKFNTAQKLKKKTIKQK